MSAAGLRRRPPALLICVLIASFGLASDDGGSVPPVETVQLEQARRIDARLAGVLLDYATPRIEGGRRALLALVREGSLRGTRDVDEPETPRPVDPCVDGEESSAPRSLWRLHVEPQGTTSGWELLRDDLPDDAMALRFGDVDADGMDELLVPRPTEILLYQETDRGPGTAGPFTVVDARDLDARSSDVRFARLTFEETSGLLPVANVGRTRFFRPARPEQANLRWSSVAEIETPVEHRLSGRRFQIHSPVAWRAGRDASGREVFATGPQVVGRQRLRTVRMIPEAGDGAGVECWARLPEPESLRESYWRMLDGRPVLIVTTMPADRLNLFGEKRLRVFALEPDRSRLGHRPLFAVETRINQWQATEVFVLDVDGDGLDDLVLGYWKGLNKSRIVLDVYRGGADGFSPTARSTAFDVRNGDRSYLDFGSDVDGDGRPDLLLVAGNRLQIHHGLQTTGGRKLVSAKADASVRMHEGETADRPFDVTIGSTGLWSVSAPDPNRPPRAVDLDGDGVSEIVFSHSGEDGRPSLGVIVIEERP